MAIERKLIKRELLDYIRRMNGKATVRSAALFLYNEDSYYTRRTVRSTIQHLRDEGANIVNSGRFVAGYLRIEGSNGDHAPSMTDQKLREMLELTTAARDQLYDTWQKARGTIHHMTTEYRTIERSYRTADKAVGALIALARERNWDDQRIALWTGGPHE